MKASEKVYWIKAGSAVAVAVISLLIQTGFGLDGNYVFLMGTIIYMGLSDLLANQMHLERNRALKIGVGAFLFIWLTTWTMLNTLVRTMG